MKKAQSDQKPRAVSDSSVKNQRLDPDQNHFRERSLTDVLLVLSKKIKVTKKDASTNTLPLEDNYNYPAVAPPVPPKTHRYYLNEARDKVEINYEDVNQQVTNQEANRNVEPGPTMTAAPPNQETTAGRLKEIDEDDTNEDSEDAVDGPTTAKHQRNTSGWSLGSFHIGPPIELMNELFKEGDWRMFLENNLQQPPDAVLPTSDEPEGNSPTGDADQGTANDDVDGNGTTRRSKSVGPYIDDIMTTVTIVDLKREDAPKVPEEEPDQPHLLPPKLTPSSQAGIDKLFRSSVFYRYNFPPPGQTAMPETPKSGNSTLEKIKAKLRKCSV